MSTPFAITMIGWSIVMMLGTVAIIGKDRKPVSPGQAMVAVLLYGIIITGAVLSLILGA